MIGRGAATVYGNGDRGDIVMHFEAGIKAAGRIADLERSDMIPYGGKPAGAIEIDKRLPVARLPGIGLGQGQAVGEQQNIGDVGETLPAVTEEMHRFRFAVQHPVADIHLQAHPDDLLGQTSVNRLLGDGRVLPERQRLPVDIQLGRKQGVVAVIVQEQDHAVAGITVLKRCIAQTDDGQTGGPEALSFVQGNPATLLGLAEQPVGLSCDLRQAAAFVPKGVGGDPGRPESARGSGGIVEFFKARGPVEHTEDILSAQENILVLLSATLFMQCFHGMERLGREGTR